LIQSEAKIWNLGIYEGTGSEVLVADLGTYESGFGVQFWIIISFTITPMWQEINCSLFSHILRTTRTAYPSRDSGY